MRNLMHLTLTLAVATAATACGPADEAQVPLYDPGSGDVVGAYDPATQTYALGGQQIPVWQIDTTFVLEWPDADRAEAPREIDDAPRTPLGDDLRDEGPPRTIAGDDVTCWQLVTSDDGALMSCRGCCKEDACEEVCVDLGGEGRDEAMHDTKDLDEPSPWPPSPL